MSIDSLASSHCDFCDYENSKPCLSCMKYLIYLGIKDGIKDRIFNNINEAIERETIQALGCNSYNAVVEGTKKALG